MIHEFTCLLFDEDGEKLGEAPIAIEMSSVNSCRPAKFGEEGGTIVRFPYGESHLDMKYREFLSIWRTCTENINLNM